MQIGRIVTYAAATALGLCMLNAPKARADEWNQKTILTFQQPVEIPGRVLAAGTYVFKLADSQADRNIVEVYDKNEQHLYGTFLAIPNYHLRPRGKTIITFEERAQDAPEAIKAWFYPGDNYGHEFVYPKARAMALAKATNQPVVAMPNETSTQSQTEMNQSQMANLKKAPVTAEQPSQQETPLGEEYTEQQETVVTTQPNTPPMNEQSQNQNNAAQEANREAPPQPAQAPAQLPQTGSDLPLIALVGMLSLAVAGSLRLAAVKIK